MEPVEIVKNADGSFMSEPQMVNYMISLLQDEKSMMIIASNFYFDPYQTEESKQMSLHTVLNMRAYYKTTFGRQIRNTFGLWHRQNPYVFLDAEPNEENIIDHPLHPDQVSARVIAELVNYYSDQF